MSKQYKPPLSQLLTYGDCREIRELPDYLKKFGLTQKDIPELIRMATDEYLLWADSDSSEVWAPVHAWRAIGQLKAEEAIEPLLDLFNEDDDWSSEELPEVYGMIGPKAIPSLSKYLANKDNGIFPRISAASSLEKIAKNYPEVREECISVLENQLKRYGKNDPELNGFLIDFLVEMKAMESLPTIQKAYEKDCVDCTIVGDFEDVEIALGLKTKRTKPPTYPSIAEKFFPGMNVEELRKKLNIQPINETKEMPPLDKAKVTASKQLPQKREERKIGRNEPCPCGSGKKYKKCCLIK